MWCKQGYNAPGRYFHTSSTPLHVAAEAGHQGIVDALLASEADLAVTDCQVGRRKRPTGAYCTTPVLQLLA